jgi:hypothetical protein
MKNKTIKGLSKVKKYAKLIERNNAKLALGYESSLDFNYGYIVCLRQTKTITQKEANILMKMYASHE